MELIILLVIVFFIGKAFGNKKKKSNDWPDEPVVYMPKKKKGCFSRLLSLIFWGFVLIVFGAFVTSLGGESVDMEVSAPSPTAVVASAPADLTIAPTAEVTTAPTIAPTAEPTAAPTAEPATLQEWAEHVAQQVYGRFDYEYTDLISVECMQVDGDPAPMVEIFAKYPDSFLRKNDERMSMFLYNVKRVTEKLEELAKAGKIEYGSILVHGRTTFVDKYGTESEGDAAQIRIKAKEAAKVTNWGNVLSDYLPDLAVSFGIHPIIKDGLSYEYHSKIRN